MLILSFESSCDETAAAVVEMSSAPDRRVIRSNIVASQIELHREFGGVVPEIASRAHIEAISGLAYTALAEAGLSLSDIDAVGVTASPGLIGALLVGVNFAKSLAFANDLPLVPVNHVRAHVAAAYLSHQTLKPPFLALVVSGGHTSIFHVKTPTSFLEIGATRDDAAGEAFDKIGRVMGLSYPCGAAMDALAAHGNPKAVSLPSPALAGDTLDFSFSGLKTAAINYLHTLSQRGESVCVEDMAASVTAAVVDGVIKKLDAAFRRTQTTTLVLAGGVAANSHLRAACAAFCEARGLTFCTPPLALCGDNGAMVGAQAYYEFLDGNIATTALNASASDE